MTKPLMCRLHLAAAAAAIAVISAFLAVSMAAATAGGPGDVRALRHGIVLGLPLLIACLATAGISGRRLAGRSRSAVIRAKKRRMTAASVIGLAVLVPCALLLDHLAAARVAGPAVMALEVTEWAFGSVNLCLLGFNLRDGLRMKRRRKAPARTLQLAGNRP